MSEKKKFSFKKELRDWGIIVAVFGLLYITGLHTEVIGTLQRVLLSTGLIQPETTISAEEHKPASYDMLLRTFDENQISLEEFKGKTIFLNFWATWCAPCIAEMPNIQNLYNDIKTEKVKFVMVSLDDDPNKALEFINRKEYTFPVYMLSSGRPAVYQSELVPTTFVISPQGSVVLRHEGMANYNTESFRKFLLEISEK